MASPYEILRVDPSADEEALERAYRERVKETHPDQGGSPREFRLVVAAYEELSSDEWSGDRAVDGPGVDEADDGGGGSAGSDGRSTSEDPPSARVEYLNYEVLDDHGWRLDDPDLFEKAAAAGLDPTDHGRIGVDPDESLLEAAESCGFAWPYACRGGACANCAVALVEGEISMPAGHVLPPEMSDRGIRLSCNGTVRGEEAKVVYNVKHLPELDDLRLPPDRFERSRAGD